MRQKRNRTILNRYTITTFAVLLVLASAYGVAMSKRSTTDAAAKPKVTPPTSIPSKFTFSGAANWYQGATSETAMALFHHKDGCFASVEYKAGSVDVAAELQKNQDTLVNSGHTVAPAATQTMTLQTSTGPQQYQLHQYSVDGSNAGGMIEGGQDLGYVQLTHGYVKVIGDCDTVDELPATISALQAVKIDEGK